MPSMVEILQPDIVDLAKLIGKYLSWKIVMYNIPVTYFKMCVKPYIHFPLHMFWE